LVVLVVCSFCFSFVQESRCFYPALIVLENSSHGPSRAEPKQGMRICSIIYQQDDNPNINLSAPLRPVPYPEVSAGGFIWFERGSCCLFVRLTTARRLRDPSQNRDQEAVQGDLVACCLFAETVETVRHIEESQRKRGRAPTCKKTRILPSSLPTKRLRMVRPGPVILRTAR